MQTVRELEEALEQQGAGDVTIDVVARSQDRWLVTADDGAHYLYQFVAGRSKPVTPGAIERRVKRWSRHHGKRIRGHVVLCAGRLSATTIAGDGKNLPKNVAVVGEWGAGNRLVASHTDGLLPILVQLAGVSAVEMRRAGILPESPRPVSAPDAAPTPPAWPTTATRTLQPGMEIDAYRLDERLGRGMSAEVWRATVLRRIPGVQLEPGAVVAVKVYREGMFGSAQSVRIQREFSIAAEVRHERFARVFDVVISASRPFHTFMVMEYVRGATLKDHIKKHRHLPLPTTVRIGLQIFDALAELHSFNAIHRDVKAANVIVVDPNMKNPQVKLVDLGIVSVDDDRGLTQTSVFLGSKHSAPLEQLIGEPLDHRADIYGAGSVMYHCYAGTPMYDRVGPEGAIVRHMLERAQDLVPRSGKDPVERELVYFINRCVAVDREDRPDTARECLEHLRRIERRLTRRSSRFKSATD